jgi:hypothetical protein
MPQAQTNKLYNTFLKGLVTEASPLTFPPNTSYDEDNCLIYVAGNRSRRLGMDFEDDYQLSSYSIAQNTAPDAALIEFVWRNANDVEGLDFLCHQVNSTIYFYDVSGNPVSTAFKSFSIDLSPYFVAGYPSPEFAPVQMTSGKGYLFIVSSAIEPLIVEYDAMTDDITVEPVNIMIRDFDGVDDDLGVDEEISTLADTHKYNLQNQGWVSVNTQTKTVVTLFGKYKSVTYSPGTVDVIEKYKDIIGKYPGNNKQWFLGKVEIADKNYQPGDFSPTLLNKVHVGNSRAPRGHFILNAFNKDRAAASGIAGLAVKQEATRPSSLCFAAGRVFYGHKNTVYFSQILSEKHKVGLCFQDNDPTSEDISDLLDNDGGVIPVPAADQIVLTKEVSNGIMVFANNGVWFIAGGEKGGFSATDYKITKVSSIGTDAPYSVVDTTNHIYWWSKTGIQRIEQQSGMFGAISGQFNSTNLTENTIDRLVKNIPSTVRKNVKGVFDYGTNTIHWMYATSDVGNTHFYNKFINFNIITESFFPWTLDYSGTIPALTGIYVSSDINRVANFDVMYIDENQVYIDTELVTIQANTITAKDTFIQYITAVPVLADYQFTISNFNNTNYVDWEVFTSTGITYNSFVETGYEILEDAVRNKSITTIQPFFRQTEEAFVLDGTDYTVDKPSSCYLTTKWDWSNTTASNRWSTKIQVYKLIRVPFVDPSNLTLNTGFNVVTTRNKVRGHGRAIQFRFECDEAGKNFDLLGWQVFYTGNTAP